VRPAATLAPNNIATNNARTQADKTTGVSEENTGVGNNNTGLTDETTGVAEIPPPNSPAASQHQNDREQPLDQYVQDLEQEIDDTIQDLSQEPHDTVEPPNRNHSDNEDEETPPTAEDLIRQAEQDGIARAISNEAGRTTRKRKPTKRLNDYVYLLSDPISHKQRFNKLVDMLDDCNPIDIIRALQDQSGDTNMTLLTEQMSAQKGPRT